MFASAQSTADVELNINSSVVTTLPKQDVALYAVGIVTFLMPTARFTLRGVKHVMFVSVQNNSCSSIYI